MKFLNLHLVAFLTVFQFIFSWASDKSICDTCDCSFRNQSATASVLCVCSEPESEVHIRASDPATRALKLKVSQCRKVFVYKHAFTGNGLSEVIIQSAEVLVIHPGALKTLNLSSLSFENIGSLDLEAGCFEGLIVDHMTVRQAHIPRIPITAAAPTAVAESFSLEHVNIGEVSKSALALELNKQKSKIRFQNVTINKIESPLAMRLAADTIELVDSAFGPSSSGIRLMGRQYVYLTKCFIVQKKLNDFFDVYSPFINLTGNTFWQYLSNENEGVENEDYYKLINFKNKMLVL